MNEPVNVDLYLEQHGFVKIDRLAEKYGVKPVTVRGWIANGLISENDVTKVGTTNYIRKDIKKPTKDRSKRGSRKGKYSYSTN